MNASITSIAKPPAPSGEERQLEKFALWSQEYDETPNPMLELEGRFLGAILPEIAGTDILDVGCGTGRWLERFAAAAPNSMTGIDFSPEMLNRARRKLGRKAVLVEGNATSLPIASISTDLVMASFVASYIAELPQFASELRRVVRSNSKVFISDVHPDTAIACNWQRGFRSGTGHVGLTTSQHTLPDVIGAFEAAGFELVCCLEPPFESPELATLQAAGKIESYYASAGLPAIYILEFRPSRSTPPQVRFPGRTAGNFRLSGARIVLGAKSAIEGDLAVCAGRVVSIMSPERPQAGHVDSNQHVLNLDGYLLLPGLINAHDHLEFGLYPNLGDGPYANSARWAADIQLTESAIIAAHQSVPKEVRLWWGAIRNLLCGVTTVCHHNPLHPELLKDEFPLRVISKFGWAHSLAMDPQALEKFQDTPRDIPFVIHAGEGLDKPSYDELFELDRNGMLDERTILVHGLALDAKSVALLNRRSASLVWCPSSNRFLFGQTHARPVLDSVDRLLLGSDSPLTGVGDFLDEVRLARRDVDVPADDLYRMVFQRAATSYRLTEGEGTIRPDATADVIAVRNAGLSPAETFSGLAAGDVELVIVRGQVQVASEVIARRLWPDALSGLQPLQVGSDVRWIRAPLGRLFREAERAVGREVKIGGKRVRHVCTAWL